MTASGQVARMHSQRIDVQGIALEQTAEEVELEIELTLLAKPSSRCFGPRTVVWRISGKGVIVCHGKDASQSADDSGQVAPRSDLDPALDCSSLPRKPRHD